MRLAGWRRGRNIHADVAWRVAGRCGTELSVQARHDSRLEATLMRGPSRNFGLPQPDEPSGQPAPEISERWWRLADELAEPLFHDLLGHVADQAGGLAAVLEHDQGRDAEDAVPHRELLVLVGVDLRRG